MSEDNAEKMAKLSSQFMKKMWEILKDSCDADATEVELYACLMATHTVAEAIRMRLLNMDVDEELIEFAIENAKNQILFTLGEQEGKFYMKGEEV